MNRAKPRVSIGIPVFNGEKYIAETLDSILSQTYENFELIISDNASTDNTKKICLEYSNSDNRVHYHHNEKNIGGPNNYNRVFALSSSEYFKWAAYDDVLAPEYLKKCVAVLDNDASIIGCHCRTGRIDQNGTFLGYYNKDLLKKIDSPKPHERFRDLIGLYYTTTPFHAVYRTNLFKRSQRHGSYIGADRNLVAELSLMGRIYEIPECLFFWREHPASYTSKFYGINRENTLNRLQMETTWWSKKNSTYFPHWKNCIEYFRSVTRIPLSWHERLFCYTQIFGWFMEEGRRFMATDILRFMSYNSNLATKLIQKIPINLKRMIIE